MLMAKEEVLLAEAKAKEHNGPCYWVHTSTIFISLLSILTLFLLCLSYSTSQPIYPPHSLPITSRGGGAGSCRMSYMSPSYIRVSGFGEFPVPCFLSFLSHDRSIPIAS